MITPSPFKEEASPKTTLELVWSLWMSFRMLFPHFQSFYKERGKAFYVSKIIEKETERVSELLNNIKVEDSFKNGPK